MCTQTLHTAIRVVIFEVWIVSSFVTSLHRNVLEHAPLPHSDIHSSSHMHNVCHTHNLVPQTRRVSVNKQKEEGETRLREGLAGQI